jgi:hypothetical protein
VASGTTGTKRGITELIRLHSGAIGTREGYLAFQAVARAKWTMEIRYLVHQVAFRTTTREVVFTVVCQMAIRGNSVEQ